jgi:hypothetical protein
MDVKEIICHVKKNMLGRIAEERNNTVLMAETVMRDGDHLEIGTMHGGSAIVAALVKREFGFGGNVVCIDPLDGYYTGTRYEFEVDPVTFVPITIETIRENEKRFGVELEIVQARSHPFPIHDRTFTTAYIDGGHTGDTPILDFINASACTTGFIVFDNCDERHRDVMKACRIAEQIWTPYKREGITCIVRHP